MRPPVVAAQAASATPDHKVGYRTQRRSASSEGTVCDELISGNHPDDAVLL
jgi:hypothetical protein